MTRHLFRLFWRLMYRNPEYLKYSGVWDTDLKTGRKARSWDLNHWIRTFRDEWFIYTHPEIDL